MRHRAATALCLILAGLPLAAGEVGIFADRLQGKAQADAFGNRYDAVKPAGFGARAGFSFLNLKVAEIGFIAAYRPETTHDLVMTTLPGAVTKGRMGYSYMAVGAQVDWKLLVSIHAGLEMRRERLAWSGLSAGLNGTTTVDRPWARAGLGFSLPVPVLSPIVRLEVSAPLKKQDGLLAGGGDLREALAPQLQAALYVGIRF
jgi:hypothetical protein